MWRCFRVDCGWAGRVRNWRNPNWIEIGLKFIMFRNILIDLHFTLIWLYIETLIVLGIGYLNCIPSLG